MKRASNNLILRALSAGLTLLILWVGTIQTVHADCHLTDLQPCSTELCQEGTANSHGLCLLIGHELPRTPVAGTHLASAPAALPAPPQSFHSLAHKAELLPVTNRHADASRPPPWLAASLQLLL